MICELCGEEKPGDGAGELFICADCQQVLKWRTMAHFYFPERDSPGTADAPAGPEAEEKGE